MIILSKKSWVSSGRPLTSTLKRNIHGNKILLCIWWDIKGVYYELLKSNLTVIAERYQQQLISLNNALNQECP